MTINNKFRHSEPHNGLRQHKKFAQNEYWANCNVYYDLLSLKRKILFSFFFYFSGDVSFSGRPSHFSIQKWWESTGLTLRMKGHPSHRYTTHSLLSKEMTIKIRLTVYWCWDMLTSKSGSGHAIRKINSNRMHKIMKTKIEVSKPVMTDSVRGNSTFKFNDYWLWMWSIRSFGFITAIATHDLMNSRWVDIDQLRLQSTILFVWFFDALIAIQMHWIHECRSSMCSIAILTPELRL